MKLIVQFIVNTLAVGLTAYLLPGVTVSSIYAAAYVALFLALFNTFIKPIVKILTLPINILTLGLFSFFVNGAIIMIASSIIEGFSVDGFGWAIGFSIVLSIVSSILGIFAK